MKKIMGVILLLIVPISGLNPDSDYQFELAWKGPYYLVSEFADLDGDGLNEILCTTRDMEMETYTLAALDIFSTVLWQVEFKGVCGSCDHVEDNSEEAQAFTTDTTGLSISLGILSTSPQHMHGG